MISVQTLRFLKKWAKIFLISTSIAVGVIALICLGIYGIVQFYFAYGTDALFILLTSLIVVSITLPLSFSWAKSVIAEEEKQATRILQTLGRESNYGGRSR